MKKRWKKLAALAVTTVMASTMAIGFKIGRASCRERV